MQRTVALLAVLTSFAALQAQSPDPAQPAPIVHAYDRGYRAPQAFDTTPASGVYVRSDVEHGVETVTASDASTEVRLLHGRADITVHHSKDHSEIVVDLPGGHVALLKDGLYTFNAETNTVRVLHGEAEAFASSSAETKGTKVKEEQQLALVNTGKLKAVEAYPYELTADLIRGDDAAEDRGDGPGYGPGAGLYGGYPYGAEGFGYPYGYGFYPYGFGYPFGVGLGFGYYGGFRGGGFGGFHGGGGFRR